MKNNITFFRRGEAFEKEFIMITEDYGFVIKREIEDYEYGDTDGDPILNDNDDTIDLL